MRADVQEGFEGGRRRVGDEHVDWPQLRVELCEGGGNLPGIAEIRAQRDAAPPERAHRRRDGARGILVAPVDERDVNAVASQPFHDGAADAARAPGHQRVSHRHELAHAPRQANLGPLSPHIALCMSRLDGT